MQDTDFDCFHRCTVAAVDCSRIAGSGMAVDTADFGVLVGTADFAGTGCCYSVGIAATASFHFAYACNNSCLGSHLC